MRFCLVITLLFISVSVFSQEHRGADIYTISRYGTVAQMDSIYKSSPGKIDSVNAMGFSPLILACYRGNVEVAQYLIKKTKQLNYCSDNGTALTATVFKGDSKLSEELLQAGADPNLGDSNGVTPLIYAIQSENKPMVELLLRYGADKTKKDQQGKGPFEYAFFSKNQEIINLLKN